MITETKILEQLRNGKITLPPFALKYVGTGRKNRAGNALPDVLIELAWNNQEIRFAADIKALSTPKVFQNAINRMKLIALPKETFPMLVFPYLSETQLEQLEKEQISGIDLCGNGIVIVPEKLLVVRSGAKNSFPTYNPIRNIYQKNSSMSARVFFVQSQFKTVKEIHEKVNRCNLLVERWNMKRMSLSTVSKVLSALEEDLIISRVDGIRLLQKDTLLDKLSQNYNLPSKNQKRVKLKVSATGNSLNNLLAKCSAELDLPIVAAGKSSVNQYAAMQQDNILSIYCPKIDRLLERLGGSQTDRFPNLEVVETETEFLYFDSRDFRGFFWASPVQVYLELMAGDKRDRETAEQVRDFILKKGD